MARKFMIVKPAPCCGNTKSVGLIRELNPNYEMSNYSSCIYCGQLWIGTKRIACICDDGTTRVVQQSRIIWLPDDEDVLSFDRENELDNVTID